MTAAEVEQLAREYATTRPAVIRLNYGVQRAENGGTAVRAIAMLPALTGAWKHRGAVGRCRLQARSSGIVKRWTDRTWRSSRRWAAGAHGEYVQPGRGAGRQDQGSGNRDQKSPLGEGRGEGTVCL